jgi:hypothetical protein
MLEIVPDLSIHVLRLPLITDYTEKVSQLIMPLNSGYNKILFFTKQKCIFKHCRKVKTINKNLQWNSASLCNTNISLWGAALERSSEKYFQDKNNVNQWILYCLNLSAAFKNIFCSMKQRFWLYIDSSGIIS